MSQLIVNRIEDFFGLHQLLCVYSGRSDWMKNQTCLTKWETVFPALGKDETKPKVLWLAFTFPLLSPK
jgi:hypothetical protein